MNKTPSIPNSGYSCVFSRTDVGLESPLVKVQTHMTAGLPKFKLVGTAQIAVKESVERIRSAIINSNLAYPNRRFTVNLSPTDLKKQGNQFDLAIALGVLIASGQVSAKAIEKCEFYAGLSLDGSLEPVSCDLIGAAINSVQSKRVMIIAAQNINHINMIDGVTAYAFKNLYEIKTWLELPPEARYDQNLVRICNPADNVITKEKPDSEQCNVLHEIIAMQYAKRAVLIALSGAHNILLIGSPGTGKTMLAEMMKQFLPALNVKDCLMMRMINSRSNQPNLPWLSAPFRNPHHTASAVAMTGGGGSLRAGEVTFANKGILFMDEFPEFDRKVLEALREPLQNGSINISRIVGNCMFPADFMLVAAMNPCPCGYFGDQERICNCTNDQKAKYRNKISGPLLDRIDLHIHIQRIDSYHDTQRKHTHNASQPVADKQSLTANQQQNLFNQTAYFASVVDNCRNIRSKLLVHPQKVPIRLLETFLANASIPMVSKVVDYYRLSRRQMQKMLNCSFTIAIINRLNQANSAEQVKVVAQSIDTVTIALEDLTEAIGYLPKHIDNQ